MMSQLTMVHCRVTSGHDPGVPAARLDPACDTRVPERPLGDRSIFFETDKQVRN